MKKYLLGFVLILTQIITAQQTNELKVKIHPVKNYPWTVLYQLKDVKQSYVNNKKQSNDSTFIYDMNGLTPGMYLLMYDMNQHNFIYFIYNNEPIHLEIFPREHNKILISRSKENKAFLPYAGKHNLLVSKLNKIEKKLAFNEVSPKDRIDYRQYTASLKKLQQQALAKSEGLLAHKYIQNMAEYYPANLRNAAWYFKERKKHFFDNLHFNDNDLQHSNILINKINNYVFSLNPPQNPKTKHLDYYKRIQDVLSLIEDPKYRNNVIFSLTASFVKVDGRVSKMLINNYINKMPADEQQKFNVTNILNQIGLSIGEKAPDFKFDDQDGHMNHLYGLTSKKPYNLLIFWSATCPHCLRAMPQINQMMKSRKDFNVIAIGLESGLDPWKMEQKKYPDFYHGIKLEKWQNPIVKTYGIHATPTFFIINSKNEIIDEPYEIKDLKHWLLQHPQQ